MCAVSFWKLLRGIRLGSPLNIVSNCWHSCICCSILAAIPLAEHECVSLCIRGTDSCLELEHWCFNHNNSNSNAVRLDAGPRTWPSLLLSLALVLQGGDAPAWLECLCCNGKINTFQSYWKANIETTSDVASFVLLTGADFKGGEISAEVALKWNRNSSRGKWSESSLQSWWKNILKLKCHSVAKEMKVAFPWIQPLSYTSTYDLCGYVFVRNGFQFPDVGGVNS